MAMRRLSPDAPEIIRVGRLPDSSPFGVVALTRGGERRVFQFAITEAGYRALKRVLDLRPFSGMPGTGYRYYFAGLSFRGDSAELVVWAESGRDHKSIDVPAPRELAGVLDWWSKLADFGEVAHLAADA